MVRSPLFFISVGAGLGLILPFVFRLVSVALGGSNGIPATFWTAFDYLQLMLWPTPLLMGPTEEPGATDLSAWGAFIVSTLANVSLYGALAALFWLGLRRSKVFLVAPALIIAAIWYAVWQT
jgi:hypothetical protein